MKFNDIQFDWRKDTPPLLLFFLMPLFCFPELFLRRDSLYQIDLIWIYHPLRILAARQWLSGQIPLWNPYVRSGFPLLAETHAGGLYPPLLLYMLPIPAYRALTLYVALHLLLAAISTYLLARLLGISRAGAAIGGLSFGFGGFLMAQIPNLNVMLGGAWLPLIFFCLLYALHTRRLKVAILSGIPLALQILAAQPQLVFYTLVLLGGYMLYRTGQMIRISGRAAIPYRRIAAEWGLLAVMGIVGVLLSAPQWLSTWELSHLSPRATGLLYEKMIEYSLPPPQWLNLALPLAFGNNLATHYVGLSGNFEETYIYAGILPLLLAFFSWPVRRKPLVIFLWLALVVAAIWAMGGYTPFYWPLQYIPGFNFFRVPARWVLIVNLALALLAGRGLDFIVAHPPHRRRWLMLLAGWGGVTAVLLLLWLFQKPLLAWIEQWPAHALRYTCRVLLQEGLFLQGNYTYQLVVSRLAWFIIPAVALITRLGVGVGLMAAYGSRRLSRRLFLGGAVALVAVDMVLSGGSAVARITGAEHWHRLSAGAEYIITAQRSGQPGRFFAITEGEAQNIVAGLGQYYPSVYEVLASSGHKSPLHLEQYQDIIDLDNELLALSLSATRFVLTNEPFNVAPHAPIELILEEEGWQLYEHLTPLSQAFVVHQAVAVPDSAASLAYLTENETFDPRQAVILETTDPLPPLPPATETGRGDEVAIITYTPTLVEIRAELAADGFLVLLDNNYPGWRASANGQPAPILTAYHFARAIYLPAGRYTVQFAYRPGPFTVGLVLSGIGLLIVLGAWLGGRHR